MRRHPRLLADGLVYHAFNRGNNRAAVFARPADHAAFLQAPAQTRQRYPFRLFAYCLMTNHFYRVKGMALRLGVDLPKQAEK